jgi:hypothetical protein
MLYPPHLRCSTAISVVHKPTKGLKSYLQHGPGDFQGAVLGLGQTAGSALHPEDWGFPSGTRLRPGGLAQACMDLPGRMIDCQQLRWVVAFFKKKIKKMFCDMLQSGSKVALYGVLGSSDNPVVALAGLICML